VLLNAVKINLNASSYNDCHGGCVNEKLAFINIEKLCTHKVLKTPDNEQIIEGLNRQME